MTYSVFHFLTRHSCLLTDYNDYLEKIKGIEGYDDSLFESGVVFCVWLRRSDESPAKLRDFAGMNRAEFCRTYDIPLATMSSWEHKKTTPNSTMVNLLAFAVLNDIHQRYLNSSAAPAKDTAK